jgi:ABC-type amino acid transport substrate-binding protein
MLTFTIKFFCFCVLIINLLTNDVSAEGTELKVAIFIEPPFVNSIDDTLVGENVDIAKLLAKAMDLRLTLIRCPFARCMDMVEKGHADMIIGIKKTSLREENLTFLEPPILIQHHPLRFFTLESNNIVINNLNDLDGLVVGILRGSASFQAFDIDSKVDKVEITTQKQLVSMLLRGHIDAFLDREESITPLLPHHVYQQKISLSTYQYDKPVKGYIAISKHSYIKKYQVKLAEQLAIAEKSGIIDTIRINNRAKLSNPTPSLK